MKLSDYVVNTVQEFTEVKHVFMLTGGMAMHLVESFGRNSNLKVVPMHHEQAAGIAANAYGRLRETSGVVLVTAGPGALNAVTPCTGAWMESNPMVFLSGQVSRANSTMGHPLRQRGIQEVDIVDVVRSVTKYAVRIDDPKTIRYHLERALFEAHDGRPGPVWIDIPVDVQGAEIDPLTQEGYVGPAPDWDLEGLPEAVEWIKGAKRPLLILGQGVRLSGASTLVKDFVEHLGIPVQTTWNGMDLLEESHPLFAGRSNVFGPRYANLVVQNADVIIGIGARFGIQHTGYNVEAFGRGAKLIMVDVDPAEGAKPGLKVDLFLRSDARFFMERFRSLWTAGGAPKAWMDYCTDIRQAFPAIPPVDAQSIVQPQYFVERLGKALPASAVFMIGSSGMGHTVSGGLFAVKQGQKAFTFKGLAAMGYGLPSTVGASFACPGRPVLTVVGEGGLQLNLQELQTIRHFGLPVTVIVFNNGGYHSIHMTQKGYFGGHFVGSGPESDVTFPHLPEVAKLYNFRYTALHTNGEVDGVLAGYDWLGGPGFLEVFIDPEKSLEPKVVSYKKADGTMESRPLEDMGPLLDRELLRKWMTIPLVDEGKA